jgi:hypothetical protein
MRVVALMCSSVETQIPATDLQDIIQDSLDYVGKVLSCASEDTATQAQAAPGVRDSDSDSGSAQGASRYGSTSDSMMWKVVVLPFSREKALDSERQTALEESCMRALTSLSKDADDTTGSSSSSSGGASASATRPSGGGSASGAGSTSSEIMAEIAARVRRVAHTERAKDVVRLIGEGKDAYLYQGTRDDCYAVCASFETRDAVPLVCRVRAPAAGNSKSTVRWRAGTTRHAVAMDVLAMIRDIASTDACTKSVCVSLNAAISGVVGKLAGVSSNGKGSASASSLTATSADLHRALAALELLCWGANDVHMRAGSLIQFVQSPGAKKVPARGCVLHVDTLAGTVCYYPVEVCFFLFFCVYCACMMSSCACISVDVCCMSTLWQALCATIL